MFGVWVFVIGCKGKRVITIHLAHLAFHQGTKTWEARRKHTGGTRWRQFGAGGRECLHKGAPAVEHGVPRDYWFRSLLTSNAILVCSGVAHKVVQEKRGLVQSSRNSVHDAQHIFYCLWVVTRF